MIDNILILYNTLRKNKVVSYQLFQVLDQYYIEEFNPFYHNEKLKVYILSPRLYNIIIKKANVINIKTLKQLAEPELRKLKLSKINTTTKLHIYI